MFLLERLSQIFKKDEKKLQARLADLIPCPEKGQSVGLTRDGLSGMPKGRTCLPVGDFANENFVETRAEGSLVHCHVSPAVHESTAKLEEVTGANVGGLPRAVEHDGGLGN